LLQLSFNLRRAPSQRLVFLHAFVHSADLEAYGRTAAHAYDFRRLSLRPASVPA
jgi:hypothetical protein